MDTLKAIVAVALVSSIGITPSCSSMGGSKTGGMSGGYLIDPPYELVVS